ncbi:MAG: V-type ATP synthase subunit F [archaeon]
MSEIAVIGNDEFTVGFRLAGIRKIINVTTDTLADETLKALEDKSIGILVLNRDDVGKLPVRIRDKVENTVQPVCVVLSKDSASEDDLRRKVKKSIGIDVWNK